MSHAQTKGSSIVNLREYALATFGGSSWDAVLDDVEPFDRRVLQSLVTVGWYPLDLEARVIRAIDRTLGSAPNTISRRFTGSSCG
jgi:hypothetical protein